MCLGLLGPQNALPFDKRLYIYLKVGLHKLSRDFWSLKFEEICSLKFQLKKPMSKIQINVS